MLSTIVDLDLHDVERDALVDLVSAEISESSKKNGRDPTRINTKYRAVWQGQHSGTFER